MDCVFLQVILKPTVVRNKLQKETITSTQPDIFTLTFRFLPETFIRRSLFSSSSCSCHDRDATWQEIGRMCGSACSCPRPGLRVVVTVSFLLLQTGLDPLKENIGDYWSKLLQAECPFWHPRNSVRVLKENIPGHYHVTFLNCNTHSGPSSGIDT